MATRESHEPVKGRYLVPAGVDWAVYDGVTGDLNLMNDAEVIGRAKLSERTVSDAGQLPDEPTPEQALPFITEQQGGPRDSSWHARVPAGATWLALRDGPGPDYTFGFGEPPLTEGAWFRPDRPGRCWTCDRETNARSCQSCLPVVLDAIVEWANREARAHDLAVATLGPWGRVRYWFGSWLTSSEIAYYGVERCRWWHGGQRLDERAWMLTFQALNSSERVYTLAEKFGRPV